MYYFVSGLFWLISLLPLRILYIFSDAIYGFVYYIARYRRDVVMDNLRLSFPEKSEAEKIKIAKKFYHNMIDTIVETIKLTTASKKFINKHFKSNWEVVNDLMPSGRKIQLHPGHNFNWELANAAVAINYIYPTIVAYMPLTSKVFDKLLYKLRSRHGSLLVRSTHMRDDLLQHRKRQYVLILVADQNPASPEKALWFNFFGRPAPFLYQPAKNAIANDCAVVFVYAYKEKRGYYKAVHTLIEESAKNSDEVELTRKYVRLLEKVIRQYPDMWLWSHRRWRHEWKEGYAEVIG